MGIIENAKDAVKLVQQIDNVELYRKILDLKNEAMELTDQLRERDEKIRLLEESLRNKGKMICRDSAYYLTDDTGKVVDGPFCTKCFDIDHHQCRLVKGTKRANIVVCPKCKVEFYAYRTFDYLSGSTVAISK